MVFWSGVLDNDEGEPGCSEALLQKAQFLAPWDGPWPLLTPSLHGVECRGQADQLELVVTTKLKSCSYPLHLLPVVKHR